MLSKLSTFFFGSGDEREILALQPILPKIHTFSEGFSSLSDEDFPQKIEEFKTRVQKQEESLERILPEVFGLIDAACKRLKGRTFPFGKEEMVWQIVPFDVQFLGAAILNQGRISEMKTGEGKTFVAAIGLILNALTGKGAHLVTVNDYLAKRDAEWMSVLYQFLGLSVGVIVHGLSSEERRDAYNCDITYGTNNELGFDYLRDNMARSVAEQVMQRGVYFAIVDEIDSILIDEARTPLIISAPAEESTEKYKRYAMLVRNLVEKEDYEVDEKQKAAILTEKGIAKMERLMGVENIYTEVGFEEVHHIEQALKANFVFKRDIDYVVKEDEIVIVDEFTGRLMPGRRYSDGLHQAIEAKEMVEVKRESITMATITFQNFFRLYEKLAGMTGTAKTEEEEFAKIYSLSTIVVPTNRVIARIDKNDAIYKNTRGKFMAVVKRIKEAHEKGQPALVGTISIEKSEYLSTLLQQERIPHNVLNAKHHEREAEIIALAGQKGAVTIATNMAGRGTDIKLGEGVAELGGLLVIGTERHESRRIDNQLRGRSGRQGDPGESQFFVSMEDDLMRLFGADRVKGMMEAMGVPDDMPIENSIISKSIENAQKKVESRNFDTRKHVVQYDDVMNKHREIIYKRRQKILTSESVHIELMEMIEKEALRLVEQTIFARERHEWEIDELLTSLSALHASDDIPTKMEIDGMNFPEQVAERIKVYLRDGYEEKIVETPLEIVHHAEREVMLRSIDSLWIEHIDSMMHLRDEVALAGYGQRDPLVEFKQLAYEMFLTLMATIQANVVSTIFKVEIEMIAPRVAPAIKFVTNEAEIEGQLSESRIVSPITPTGREMEVPEHDGAVLPLASAPQVIRVGNSSQQHEEKVGRNDLCPCGSGKKYKKCHGA